MLKHLDITEGPAPRNNTQVHRRAIHLGWPWPPPRNDGGQYHCLFFVVPRVPAGDVAAGGMAPTGETLSGAACSKANRTASVRVSIGVVVQFMCGAGLCALQRVPFLPMSTVTLR